MKGKISVGSKVYRIETAKLNKSISPTFKEDKNFRKVKLNGEIIDQMTQSKKYQYVKKY